MRRLAVMTVTAAMVLVWEGPARADDPPVVTATPQRDVFYPVQDGYQDSVKVRVLSNETGEGSYEVLDGAGAVVRDAQAFPVAADVPTWAPRFSPDEGAIPAGSYTIRVSVLDSGGSTTTVDVTVTASAAKLVTKRATVRTRARKTELDRYVGSCSKLASPSSHGWRRSQGYYSRAKCGRGGKPSIVATTNFLWLPPSIENDYGRQGLRVGITGTKARKRAEAHIVLGIYRKSDNDFTHRRVVRSSRNQVRTTMLTGVSNRQYIRTTAEGRAYVVFGAGLTEGSRFDVKSFEARVWRTYLLEPDGTIIVPRADLPGGTPRSVPPIDLRLTTD